MLRLKEDQLRELHQMLHEMWEPPKNVKEHAEREQKYKSALEKLIQADPNIVNYRYKDPVTGEFNSLLRIASRNYPSIVKFLLENNANPNLDEQEKEDLTPLMVAAQHGQTEAVRALLEKNANPNFFGSKQYTALIDACLQRNNNIKIVELLLKHNANPNPHNIKDESKDASSQEKIASSPLFAAYGMGHSDIAILLLENGARPKDDELPQLFKIAIKKNDQDMIKQFLKHGLSPYTPDKDGRSPIQIAKESASDIYRILMKDQHLESTGNIESKGPEQQAAKSKWTWKGFGANSGEPKSPSMWEKFWANRGKTADPAKQSLLKSGVKEDDSERPTGTFRGKDKKV